MNYINIAFNLPLNSLFTYSVPESYNDSVLPGMRAFVPFGKRNITGIIVEHTHPSDKTKIKPVVKLLDTLPLIDDELMSFCKWISEYYFCPLGEVLFSAIPRGIDIESKMVYTLITSQDVKLTGLKNEIAKLLYDKSLTAIQLSNKLGGRNIYSALASMLKENIISAEFITSSEKLKPRLERFISPDFPDGYDEKMLEELIQNSPSGTSSSVPREGAGGKLLARSEKQVFILKYLLQNGPKDILLKQLLTETGTSVAQVNALIKKELIKSEYKEVDTHSDHDFSEIKKTIVLNAEQKLAEKEIKSAIKSKEFKPFLLFGVTGSGKTQVYLEAIRFNLSLSRTAIVLVPEISLTPQLIYRFKSFFGDIIGVIHSRLTDRQRYEVFKRLKNNEIKIVIGARSALFAPMKNLGIIIVDEEHDSSYKQTEKNPKYNARDSALIRAKLNNAVTVLGSATPSLETYYNALEGKYKLLSLPHRAMKTVPPKVEVVNMLIEQKPGAKRYSSAEADKVIFSSRLIAYIDEALNKKQSVILFQNRRGYSAYLECRDCGYVKMCPNCDITLIHHKFKDYLRCHYCGYSALVPENCDICHSPKIILKGTGTEKIEEYIASLFPNAKVRRMDSDTVRGKDGHRKLLRSFYDREFDILVGTQMISKGLDFPNVYLVGVVSADVGLLNPDFRSSERTFQLLTQVSGRSGRVSDFGKVIIQTMHPEHYIFEFVKEHDYISFYQKEIIARKNFSYPPFSRMVLIEITGKDAGKAHTMASKLFLYLKNNNSSPSIELYKPVPALVFKIKNIFRFHIIIKSLRNEPAANLHSLLAKLSAHIESQKLHSDERINIDVDPVNW